MTKCTDDEVRCGIGLGDVSVCGLIDQNVDGSKDVCLIYFFFFFSLLVFFFFKQKTAYEIYQCDWSSDVCSSDLIPESHL